MMITATLYFEKGVDVGGLVKNLKCLPELIKPVYFAKDEGKIIKTNVLSDEDRFLSFRKENPTGFFLYTENKTFIDISTRHVGHAEVTLYLADGLPSELVEAFFKRLVESMPVFGFASDEDEYKHRNQYRITIGKNHIEDWIGRRLEKYISGVYWYTLVSNGLLKRHGIKLTDLAAEATALATLGDGSSHLLKFFDSPEDWKENAERLDNLCERVDGVFSRRSVEAAVAGITDYLEYDAAIAHWR